MSHPATGDGPLLDARDRCRDAIEQAHLQGGDPLRALWPSGAGRYKTDAHEAAADAQAALCAYVEEVSAHKQSDTARWNEAVTDDHEFPDGTRLPVSLADLDEWKDIKYQHGDIGEIHNVILPVAYSRELFRQANRVARGAGVVENIVGWGDRDEYR